jgi:RimJ/RimL family protein N-acetyltransferase
MASESPSAPATLTLRRLEFTESDLEALQAVLEAAPDYHRRTHGGAPEPDEAIRLFEEIPPDKKVDEKRVYGIFLGQELIGCGDVLYRYPNSDTACIGLLLLREDYQGEGYGRRAYELLEATVLRSSSCRTLRIGVLMTNEDVARFWEKMGFVATGQFKPWQAGTITTRIKVMQKRLAPARPRPSTLEGNTVP